VNFASRPESTSIRRTSSLLAEVPVSIHQNITVHQVWRNLAHDCVRNASEYFVVASRADLADQRTFPRIRSTALPLMRKIHQGPKTSCLRNLLACCKSRNMRSPLAYLETPRVTFLTPLRLDRNELCKSRTYDNSSPPVSASLPDSAARPTPVYLARDHLRLVAREVRSDGHNPFDIIKVSKYDSLAWVKPRRMKSPTRPHFGFDW